MPTKLYLLLLLFVPYICKAQKSKTALFVGNSYTFYNNMPNLIAQIADSKGHQFTYKQHTPGGASFSSHIQDTSWHHLLRNHSYNYIILQGQSAELSGNNYHVGKHLSSNYYQAEYLHQLNKMHDSCSQALFYMTWGYKWNDLQDYLYMQDNVSANYVELAQTMNASVAPVGEAWRNIILNNPNIDLHSSDLSHPNLAGSYLAACVFYMSIFKESPQGAWHPSSISASVASTLQQAAYETVINQAEKWNYKGRDPLCVQAPYNHKNALWETYDLQTNQPVEKIQFPTTKIGYAKCSFPHMLYRTNDSGANWDSLKTPNGTALFDFHFVTDCIGYLVTSGYVTDSTILDSLGNPRQFNFPRLFKTIDCGDSWQRIPLDTALYSVHNHGFLMWTFLPNINIYFDDEQNGTILFSSPYDIDSIYSLKTNNGGLQWNFSKTKLNNAYPYPKFISSDTAYLSSSEESNDTLRLWQTTNGGKNWIAYKDVDFNCCESIYRDQHIHTIHQTREGILAANNLRAPWIMQTKNAGTDWDTLTLVPMFGHLEAIDELQNGKLYALFENPKNHRIAVSDDFGKTWRLDSYHEHELNVITHTDEYIYAAGKRGIILRRKLDPVLPPSPPTPYNHAGILVYPNPSNTHINFQLPPTYADYPVRLKLYDIGGRIIDDIWLRERNTNYNINKLSAGIYFYKSINFGRQTVEGKFLVR